MIDSIEKYISELKSVMRQADAATRQDAISDAEDHLRSALAEQLQNNPGQTEEEALAEVINNYGSPEETAESYNEMDRIFPERHSTRSHSSRRENRREGFFAIFHDTSAWGAALYSILSLATGIIYFTIAVTGISLSVSLMILIIGIPVAVGFFFTFHGLAFLEGRLVEALLGVRMPRRQRFFDTDMKLADKVKRLLLKRDSWLIVLYFIIMLPLGILYFTLTVTLFSVSLSLMASPFIGLIFGTGWFYFDNVVYGVPLWTLPLFAAAGFFLFKGTLHLLKKIGSLQGRLAKAMLVARSE